MKRNTPVTTLTACLTLCVMLSGCITVHLGNRSARAKLQETVVQGKGWNKILLLDITGFLTDAPPWRPSNAPSTSLHEVKEKLRKAGQDHRVKAVILRINSPGGTVTASDTIYEEIRRFKEEKKIPVLALTMDAAASGGYYTALSADRIIAQPTTITGSIGVIVQKFDVHQLLSKIGILNDPVKSGPHKDMGSPFRPPTDEEKAILQETIDFLYRRFVDIVAENRNNLTREEAQILADGRIYTAEQALEHGLVDEIAYLDDVIDNVKEMLGLQKARVIIYHLPYAYAGNIYSAVPWTQINEIHLLDLERGRPWSGTPFLYLWEPGIRAR